MKNKPIFMSLGSQYSLTDSLHYLWPFHSFNYLEKLKKILAEKFSGEVILTYKGRESLQNLLQNLKNPLARKYVFFQGFACYAIEEAVVKSGFKPGFVDLGENSVNFDLQSIKAASDRYGLPAALIVQNTLGIPVNLAPISDWCSKNQVTLIDDLAQSFGAKIDGSNISNYNVDAIVCSFGRDKVVDGVSGGAAVIINSDHFDFESLVTTKLASLPILVRVIDYLYPFLTTIIQRSYPLGIGKALHKMAKKLKIMSTPLYSAAVSPTKMSNHQAKMIVDALFQLDNLAKHRRTIAHIYFSELKSVTAIKIMTNSKLIEMSSNLRFPLRVPDPNLLIEELAKNEVYISDRWYRQAIDCSSLKCHSQYVHGDCPNAEDLANTALQLPTHTLINSKVAKEIATVIKEFYVT
jgi:dTDP-4-amino-4,6-dideoxygalactose transaminase